MAPALPSDDLPPRGSWPGYASAGRSARAARRASSRAGVARESGEPAEAARLIAALRVAGEADLTDVSRLIGTGLAARIVGLDRRQTPPRTRFARGEALATDQPFSHAALQDGLEEMP